MDQSPRAVVRRTPRPDREGFLNTTTDVVQGVEKNIVQGNEIITDEIGKMERRLIARLDKLEAVVFSTQIEEDD